MILIKNKQRKYPLDTACVRRMAQVLLDALGYGDFDVGIWFTNNRTMANYNRKYRGKHGPTDILSFPIHTDIKAGRKIVPDDPDDKDLGSIMISLEFVYTDSRWRDVPESERLEILLVHGICHLLGYDHITDADYAAMHKKELSLLKLLRGN